MPTLHWRGPTRSIRTRYGYYDRATPVSVTQEWLDERRKIFDDRFEIEDDYPGVLLTQDDGDGLPDNDWLKADIKLWLEGNGVEVSSIRTTKARMLEMVTEVLTAGVTPEEE